VQQEAGADPAILMHMLHGNIDQIFSLLLPQDWVIVCLCFYCLNYLHFGSLPPQINDGSGDGRQRYPCRSEEEEEEEAAAASQINIFSFNIGPSEDRLYIALETYLDLIFFFFRI